MFTIKERALRAFTEDVCKLANESPTERIRNMIHAIAMVITATGVGQDPCISEDENFLEYMQALSIGVTRLFKMPASDRLQFVQDIQRRVGLPPLESESDPSDPQPIWLGTELDNIDPDIFQGVEFSEYMVHRPLLPSPEVPAASLYVSGDISLPATFKLAARGASTIIGRKIPLVPSAVRGCPPFYGRSKEKNRRREDYVKWRSGFTSGKATFSDKTRVRIWNTAHSIDELNKFLATRTSHEMTKIALGSDPTIPILETPLLFAQLLLKYAPVNSISRSKPTVRLKHCLALLLN